MGVANLGSDLFFLLVGLLSFGEGEGGVAKCRRGSKVSGGDLFLLLVRVMSRSFSEGVANSTAMTLFCLSGIIKQARAHATPLNLLNIFWPLHT